MDLMNPHLLTMKVKLGMPMNMVIDLTCGIICNGY